MAQWKSLAGSLAVLMAVPVQAETVVSANDAMVVWRPAQLVAPAAGGAGADTFVYFIKQWWLTPQWGLYGFYGTQQTAGLRLQGRWQFQAADADKPWLTLTGMGGYRAIGMGSSLATFSTNLRDGPELALAAALPLAGGLSLSANVSYAAVFGSTAPSGSLAFYGANLSYAIGAATLSVGGLGAFFAPFAGGLTFHDLGPTAAVSYQF